MEETRMHKGEKYWFVNETANIEIATEHYSPLDSYRYNANNYFLTLEEAEDMARKLRAVLNGADVIEIPSEEDITEKIFSTAGEIVGRDREITVSDCMNTVK